MNVDQLREIILTGLKQIAPASAVDALAPDEDIRKVLDLDSFDHLNFLIGVGTQVGIDIPEKDYGKLDTLARITEYLTAHTSPAPA